MMYQNSTLKKHTPVVYSTLQRHLPGKSRKINRTLFSSLKLSPNDKHWGGSKVRESTRRTPQDSIPRCPNAATLRSSYNDLQKSSQCFKSQPLCPPLQNEYDGSSESLTKGLNKSLVRSHTTHPVLLPKPSSNQKRPNNLSASTCLISEIWQCRDILFNSFHLKFLTVFFTECQIEIV